MPELAQLQYFHFIRPYWLVLLVPFFYLVWFQYRKTDLRSQWRAFFPEHLLKHMIVKGSQRRIFSPLWIFPIIGILLSAALAGPSWERRPSPYSEDSAALVIAIDLSESMSQSDVQPSRLQRAKQKIQDLLEKRGDAYTALLAYSGSAHTVLPLCNDSDVLAYYVDALDVGILPREGKAPESVLPILQAIFEQTESPATVLFINDGATELSAQPFSDFFEDSKHQLLIWGIGSNESASDTFASNIVPLQEQTLKSLATAGGGYYQPLTVDKTDVEAIYRRINNAFLAAEDESRPWLDAGYSLVWPLAMLYLFWFRRGWTLKW